VQSIPAYLREQFKPFLELPALRYAENKERKIVTYRELGERIDRFARGLVKLGIKPGDKVFLLADNSHKWIVADLGILAAGAVSVPRGADTPPSESEYILRHSGACAVIAENGALLDALPNTGLELKFTAVIDGEFDGATGYDQIMEKGAEGELPEDVPELATVVYTSGTTGVPKGVMLSHANIMHNILVVPPIIGIGPPDRFLSVLPSWHMFERTVEYAILANGATLSYSSLRTLKIDLASESPTFLVAVPRLFEGLHDGFFAQVEKKSPFGRKFAKFLIGQAKCWSAHCLRLRDRIENPRAKSKGSLIGAALGSIFYAPLGLLGKKMVGGKVQAALGGRLRGAVSGGGMLPLYLDHFLTALGVPVVVGYGLTETSPIVTVRRFEDNVLGTIGRAVPQTELKITDAAGKEVPQGTAGEVQIRGPQVMKGYLGNEEATAAVLDKEGWFKTGDLVAMTKKGDLIFTGRLKETIVLAGGENIEPYPIESRILESPFVNQVMIVGQDKKSLGALIYPEPERTEAAAKAEGITVEMLIRREVFNLVTPESGFRSLEKVGRVGLIDHEFGVEDGTMTRTLKLKRNVIQEKYADLIDDIYEKVFDSIYQKPIDSMYLKEDDVESK
jgi:long-chain acyl-CoA synthetase